MRPFDWIMISATVLAVVLAIWANRHGKVWNGAFARLAAHIFSVGATIGVFPPRNKADNDKSGT